MRDAAGEIALREMDGHVRFPLTSHRYTLHPPQHLPGIGVIGLCLDRLQPPAAHGVIEAPVLDILAGVVVGETIDGAVIGDFSTVGKAGLLHLLACAMIRPTSMRKPLILLAYTTAVLLLAWWPWNAWLVFLGAAWRWHLQGGRLPPNADALKRLSEIRRGEAQGSL